jgi:hypothetical protein
MSPLLPANAIVTSDSGSCANWFARDYRVQQGQSASLSGGLASMGAAVPYAIGAKFAHPDRPVIALVGDGAMQMNNMAELITVQKYWKRWADPRGLLDKCIAYAKAHRHPEFADRTIWEVFEAERPKLVPYAGRFDGFHAVPASVSKTCLVRFDNNKYSVAASAVGRPIEVQAYADRIVIRQDGRVVAEHQRSFGRGETVYDPWHYVPVLARKPGALRNGAPFKDWVLPAAIERVRRKLTNADDGNRQMVDILNAVLTDGLPAVEAACAEALGQGVHSADVVLNILARQREPAPPANILTPAALTLRHAPIADCARYDNLRRTI